MSKPVFSGIDLTFKLLDFRKTLKLLKLLDFKRTDITLNANEDTKRLYTYKELEHPYENGRKLSEILEEEELVQTDLFVFMGDMQKTAINNPSPVIRELASENFYKAVEYAKACECSHMTILPGVEFDGNYGHSMKMASKELEWRVECAAQQEIVLSVEPHIGSIIDTPYKTMELLSATKGLTLTLDYSHFIKNGIKQSTVDELIPYAKHMHFRNAANGSSQTVFEESEIDYLMVVQLLKKHQYKDGLTIEFCSDAWEQQNRVDTIGETIVLRDYLLGIWEAA